MQVFVEIPAKLSAPQRELLESYAETENNDVMPHRKTFLDKLKDYFGNGD